MSEHPIKKDYDDYELREEYDLSQMPIMPKGRYAPEHRLGKNLVLLDPEVARAFPTDEAVNTALRLVLQIAQIPQGKKEDAVSGVPQQVQSQPGMGRPEFPESPPA